MKKIDHFFFQEIHQSGPKKAHELFSGKERWLLSLLIAMLVFTGPFYKSQVGPPTSGSGINNGYSFAQTLGVYTPLSSAKTVWQSGAVLINDAVSDAIPLPWSFKFNGKSYNSIWISNNGYITFGAVPFIPNTVRTPVNILSTDTPEEVAVAGFAANLFPATNAASEIAYETVGTNFVVQFKDLQGSSSATQRLNFQIQLNSTNNSIAIVYGECVSGNTVFEGQVGLKGAGSNDVNNRAGTNWTATTPGTSKEAVCAFGNTNAASVSSSGLTFTYSPGSWLPPPSVYASLPFTETFSKWENGNSIEDLPNVKYWRSWPSRGESSWRASNHNSIGFTSSSGWVNNFEDTPTPIVAPAQSPTARFHSYGASLGKTGYMDLYIDLSKDPRIKEISFNYINVTGKGSIVDPMSDSLSVQLSVDGGLSFVELDQALSAEPKWTKKTFFTTSNEAKAIIRFLGQSNFRYDDIFIDNLTVKPVDCPTPNHVNISSRTSKTAFVSWKENGNATSWDIEYGAGNFTPTGIPTLTVAENPHTLTGLIPDTDYTFYIRANCGSNNSEWAGPFTFHTLCASREIPYFEDFNDYNTHDLLVCFTKENLTKGIEWFLYDPRLYSSDFTGYVLAHLSSQYYDANAWAYTPGLTLHAGKTYMIKFKVATVQEPPTEKLKVAIGSAAHYTEMNEVLVDYPVLLKKGVMNSRVYYTPKTTGEYYLGFNAYSDKNQFLILLDDISVSDLPTCVVPDKPTIENIRSESATARWAVPLTAPSNGYDIYYSNKPTPPNSETLPNFEAVPELTKELTGLSPFTDYYVWIRSHCAGTDRSEWSDVAHFKTICEPLRNLPYVEDFESYEPNEFIKPRCFSFEGIAPSLYGVHFDNSPSTMGGWYFSVSVGAAATHFWAFTPGIFLEAGKTYKLSYNYTGQLGPELQVAYGTEAKESAMIHKLATYKDLVDYDVKNDEHLITPTESQFYYFGFLDNSGQKYSAITLDNIKVEEATLATDNFKTEEIKLYPNPFHDEIHVSDAEKVKSISVFDLSGKLVKEISQVTSVVNLGNLNSGLYMVQLHLKDGTVKVQKMIKK